MMETAALNIEVIEGPDAGLQVPFHTPLVIGREAGVELRLADARVSRRHARITPREGSAVIEDLGSANGTFVKGVQLHAPAVLAPGDEVLLGTSVLKLRSADQITARPSAMIPIPPALAAPERQPAYVAAAGSAPVAPTPAGPPDLARLLDVRVKAQARLAPLALLVLVAFALIIYFAAH